MCIRDRGSLGRTAQDGHLDSHTAPELCYPLDVLGSFTSSPVPNKPKVSVDVKQHERKSCVDIDQELCESRGGRPGLSVLTSLLVSADVKLY